MAPPGTPPDLLLQRRKGRSVWPLEGARTRRHRYLAGLPAELRALSPDEPQTGDAVAPTCGLYDPALLDEVRQWMPAEVGRMPRPSKVPVSKTADADPPPNDPLVRVPASSSLKRGQVLAETRLHYAAHLVLVLLGYRVHERSKTSYLHPDRLAALTANHVQGAWDVAAQLVDGWRPEDLPAL